MMDSAAENLAKNLKRLRQIRGLTQDKLAKLSNLPRPTWANLESGSANPTLVVLMRVASTLQVSLEELISEPREEIRFFPADEVPTQKRGLARIRKMLPEGLPGVEFDRMELPTGVRMAGVPHRSGTREYLTCEAGRISLSVAGDTFDLTPGDVVVFKGDQRHSYANLGSRLAVGYSVVLLSARPG